MIKKLKARKQKKIEMETSLRQHAFAKHSAINFFKRHRTESAIEREWKCIYNFYLREAALQEQYVSDKG